MRSNMHSHRLQRGFNLVEVLLAMAILGVVVISIMGLFFMGRRNVYGGRKLTEAVAVATKVSEDLSGMTRAKIFSTFNILDTTALTSVTTLGGPAGGGGIGTYTGSIRRATDTISATTEAGYPTGILSRWKALIPQSTMINGLVEVVITPTLPSNAGTQPVTSAQFVKVRVVVSWSEFGRPRAIVLDTVKSQP